VAQNWSIYILINLIKKCCTIFVHLGDVQIMKNCSVIFSYILYLGIYWSETGFTVYVGNYLAYEYYSSSG
jgi:hypothetical protein